MWLAHGGMLAITTGVWSTLSRGLQATAAIEPRRLATPSVAVVLGAAVSMELLTILCLIVTLLLVLPQPQETGTVTN
jgi:hypothetical protein